jgi:hypothetical protein
MTGCRVILTLSFLAAMALPVGLGQRQRQQTKAGCPPSVGQYLVVRERPQRVRKRVGEEIARIVVRENNYFGRTRCSVPDEVQDETAIAGGGGSSSTRKSLSSLIRVVEGSEEDDEPAMTRGTAKTLRRRLRSCTLYLAAADFPEPQLELRVLLMTELIPGLAAYCDSPLAAQANIVVEFCQGDGEDQVSRDCSRTPTPLLPRDVRFVELTFLYNSCFYTTLFQKTTLIFSFMDFSGLKNHFR